MSDRALYAAGARNPVRIRRPKIGDLAHQAQGVRIFAEGEIPGAREEQAPPLPLTLRPFYAILKPLSALPSSKQVEFFQKSSNETKISIVYVAEGKPQCHGERLIT